MSRYVPIGAHPRTLNAAGMNAVSQTTGMEYRDRGDDMRLAILEEERGTW